MLAGCAAAVTIPKDYFYSVYYMDEGKVDAWLNGEMPLESELTADIIESVAEIMAGERAAMLAAFRIAEGDEPSAEAVQRFRDACANAVLDSALGRRAVFKDSPGAFGVRSVEVIREKYFVCAVCMLFFSVSLGIMKTVPDELQWEPQSGSSVREGREPHFRLLNLRRQRSFARWVRFRLCLF